MRIRYAGIAGKLRDELLKARRRQIVVAEAVVESSITPRVVGVRKRLRCGLERRYFARHGTDLSAGGRKIFLHLFDHGCKRGYKSAELASRRIVLALHALHSLADFLHPASQGVHLDRS